MILSQLCLALQSKTDKETQNTKNKPWQTQLGFTRVLVGYSGKSNVHDNGYSPLVPLKKRNDKFVDTVPWGCNNSHFRIKHCLPPGLKQLVSQWLTWLQGPKHVALWQLYVVAPSRHYVFVSILCWHLRLSQHNMCSIDFVCTLLSVQTDPIKYARTNSRYEHFQKSMSGTEAPNLWTNKTMFSWCHLFFRAAVMGHREQTRRCFFLWETIQKTGTGHHFNEN